jgi:hypothetical protein
MEQIGSRRNAMCSLGVHGNGLSHVCGCSPRRYVVEIFWQFKFVVIHMTASQLMHDTIIWPCSTESD